MRPVIFIVLLISLLPFGSHSQISFREVSDSLNFTNKAYSANLWGAGVSFYDVDQDGWDDITMLGTESNGVRLYLNKGGTLQEVNLNLGIVNMGHYKRPLWFDYDNDGDQDLLLTFVDSTLRLFEQTGPLIFTNVTYIVGLDTTAAVQHNVAVADVDRNNYLDIYVCTYDNDTPANNILYLNDGSYFTDITTQAGVGDSSRHTHSTAIIDVNQDGWLDIYTMNDFAEGNQLYINNGDTTFDELSTSALDIDMDGMGYDIADINQDGYLDLFLSNTSFNKFFLSDSTGGYEEVADSLDIDTSIVSWGCNFMDVDLDGDQDLAVISGVFDTMNLPIDNFLYENTDTGFVRYTNLLYSLSTESFASAIGDLNNDGLMDLAITNGIVTDGQIWQNTSTPQGKWLKLQLSGVNTNTNAFNSTVTTYINNTPQKYFLQSQQSFLGQHSQNLNISLGDSNTIDSLVVDWFNSGDTTLYNVEGNQSIKLVEGGSPSPMPTIYAPDGVYICTNDSIRLVLIGDYSNVTWSNNQTGDTIYVYNSGSYHVTVTNQFGQTAQSHTLNIYNASYPSFALQAQNLKCYEKNFGSINLIESSGQGPLDIVWDDGSEQNLRFNLSIGTYYVTVTNEFGCVKTNSVTLTQPPLLEAEITGNDPLCYDQATGQSSVVGSGGTPPYSYFWSTGEFVSTINSLTAGSYTCTISDILNCKTNRTVTITDPTELQFDTSSVKSLTTQPSWTANAPVFGGIPPYSFRWSHDTLLNSPIANNLDTGTYTVSAIDSNGCRKDINFTFYLNVIDEDTTTGIGSERSKKHFWYPNPTNGVLSYSGFEPTEVTVRSINGSLVLSSTSVLELDLTRLNPGTYFIETRSHAKVEYQRIVIQR